MDADISTMQSLRLDWETDDQWALRSAFLKRNWDEYPLKQLVCLSQVFINMEFMGCRYSGSVMEKVHELGAGLTEERRETRRKVIEKTFVKASDQQANKSSSSSTGPANGARVVDGRTAAPMKSPFAPPAKKCRQSDEFDSEPKTPQVSAKEKIMTLVKAQLSIAPTDLGPMELLNHATQRAKTTWKQDFVKITNRQEFYLSIEGVLILHQVYQGDKTGSKAGACALVNDLLQRNYLQVKQESFNDDKITFALYTSTDKKQGYQGPEDKLFAQLEGATAALGVGLSEQLPPVLDGDPYGTLAELCDGVKLSLEVQTRQLSGWKHALDVIIGGVVISSHTVEKKDGGKDKEKQNETKAAREAIELLMKKFHRVVEDAGGRLRLVAADKPVSDEQVRKVVSAGTSGIPPCADSSLTSRLRPSNLSTTPIDQEFSLLHMSDKFVDIE